MGSVRGWGRLTALLVLSVVLAVAGPSADAQSDWSQVGADIDGEVPPRSVATNAAGDRVIIGADMNDGANGPDSGHARVYQLTGGAWEQLGGDIDGEAGDDRSGYSVAMNAAGDRVIIGANLNDGNGVTSGHARVYAYDGTAWAQLGADIDGEAAGDGSGISVAMNAAGTAVIIGANVNDGNGDASGHARVYAYDGTAWEQFGADIDGEAAGDQFGISVAMSASGLAVIIGANLNDSNGSNSGHAQVYEWNGTTWVQIGGDIDGAAVNDQSGISVAMSAAGTTVIIGALANDDAGFGSGHARVYQLTGGAWVQLGDDIDGEAAFDESGGSVSMNAAGTTVAIGAYSNDGNGSNSGHVRVYAYDGGAWVQVGVDIDGAAAGDQSGGSVAMNAAGDTVIIGANGNDGSGEASGQARVYTSAAAPTPTPTPTPAPAAAAAPMVAAPAAAYAGPFTVSPEPVGGPSGLGTDPSPSPAATEPAATEPATAEPATAEPAAAPVPSFTG
jgi:hypothetical protein